MPASSPETKCGEGNLFWVSPFRLQIVFLRNSVRFHTGRYYLNSFVFKINACSQSEQVHKMNKCPAINQTFPYFVFGIKHDTKQKIQENTSINTRGHMGATSTAPDGASPRDQQKGPARKKPDMGASCNRRRTT